MLPEVNRLGMREEWRCSGLGKNGKDGRSHFEVKQSRRNHVEESYGNVKTAMPSCK
jgi:hypothetical protein